MVATAVSLSCPSIASVVALVQRDAPLVFDDVALDLIDSLRDEILARSRRERSIGSKNIGGWKSAEDFLDAGAGALFRARVARDFLAGHAPLGWAMVNRRGSEHLRHVHPGSRVSGCFYVATGDPLVPTIFERVPAPLVGDSSRVRAGEVAVEPRVGRLVLFAGTTWHRVPKYGGEEPRITVAIDLRSHNERRSA
jgi:hypothetical protein